MPSSFPHAIVVNPTKTYSIKIMKKLIILLAVVTASLGSATTFAQDAAQLQEMSMKACDAPASQAPEAQRESMTQICKCTVENTDYESLMAKTAAGDTSAQTDAVAVAQKCAEDQS